MTQAPSQPDPNAPRTLNVIEEPLDAANQSLAEALRASFRILKGIMLVLVVLFLVSNVRRIESHEQALVLRLGKLQPGPPREAGLVWAFPYPIDRIVVLPTRRSNELLVTSHTFRRRGNEINQPLSFISRGPSEGLNPSLDGALLTADAGLVHTQWKITYKIDDVVAYLSRFSGREVEAAERLIKTLVETTGIQVSSEMTAEEFIRTRLDFVQEEMRRRLNERLVTLESGIGVTRVEMFEPTPPISVRRSFDATQRAESERQSRISRAEQERTRILSEAAGATYRRLLDLIDRVERTPADDPDRGELVAELDLLLTEGTEGEVGRRIKDAGSYLSRVVGQMQSDVDLYRTLLPEYRRNPQLLMTRLWEQTRQQIYTAFGVVKVYAPQRSQFRLKVPLDPDQKRKEEERRLQEQPFDVRRLEPSRLVPVGPEMD